MKEVHKKSIDPAVNQTLLTAYRQQSSLIWDRAEEQQPQCGFGRLSICCSDCQAGPCRINPFNEADQQTSCGKDKHDLTTGDFLRRAADGSLALVKLVRQSGLGYGEGLIEQLVAADDEMLLFENFGERLAVIGRCTRTALEALRQYPEEICGTWQPAAIEVNLGILQAGAVNIIFHGHVDLKIVSGITAAAHNLNVPVNLVAMCGNELNLPILTNYDSQEVPLLTGVVDLLIIGNQCVMPSFGKLADYKNIPVVRAVVLKNMDDYKAAIITAHQAYQHRKAQASVIPAVKSEAYVGYTLDNSRALFQCLAEKYLQGSLKGVIYLGGCGNVANTQDFLPVKLATAFIDAGYLVITAGCAGTALAKAGLCHPTWKKGEYSLSNVLPSEIPPVLNIGSCHDAGELLRMAAVLRQSSIPLFAVFPEVTHNKVLATAIAFAVSGINTWLDYKSVFADDALPKWLNEKLSKQAGGRIWPLTGVEDLLKNLTEVADGQSRGR